MREAGSVGGLFHQGVVAAPGVLPVILTTAFFWMVERPDNSNLIDTLCMYGTVHKW
jgi:hypothetical protein